MERDPQFNTQTKCQQLRRFTSGICAENGGFVSAFARQDAGTMRNLAVRGAVY
jgi:hypothetical protein